MRRAIARARLPPGRTAAASPEVLAQMARRLMCRAWPRPQQCTPGSPSGAAVRHHGVAWRRACRLAQYKCSAQALSTGAQHGLGTGAHRQACPLPPARSRRAPHTLAHGAQADDDDSYVRPYLTLPPCGAQADDDDSYISRTNHCERAGSSELSKSRSRSVSPTPQLIGGGQGERLDGKEFFRRCVPDNPKP